MSAVEIANLALSRVGDEGEISALDEDSRAARAIQTEWAATRRAVLRDHPWAFALRRVLLPALAAQPEWGAWVAHERPADFVRFVESGWQQTWKLEGRHILKAADGPLALVYVADIEDASAFDPLFTDALATRLALQVASRLTGEPQMRHRLEGEYQLALAKAQRAQGMETLPRTVPDGSWVMSRWGLM